MIDDARLERLEALAMERGRIRERQEIWDLVCAMGATIDRNAILDAMLARGRDQSERLIARDKEALR